MDNQQPNSGSDVPGAPNNPTSTRRVQGAMDPPASGPLAQLEAWLYDMLVVKAPFQLPVAAKDWIVRYGPWITLVVGILLALTVIPGLMAAMALAGYAATLGGVYGVAVVGPMFYLALVILAIQLIIMFVSVPMLLKRQRKGWLLVFYSSIVGLVYTLFNTFSYGTFAFGSLLSGLVGAVIGLYFIFQIRSYYKN